MYDGFQNIAILIFKLGERTKFCIKYIVRRFCLKLMQYFTWQKWHWAKLRAGNQGQFVFVKFSCMGLYRGAGWETLTPVPRTLSTKSEYTCRYFNDIKFSKNLAFIFPHAPCIWFSLVWILHGWTVLELTEYSNTVNHSQQPTPKPYSTMLYYWDMIRRLPSENITSGNNSAAILLPPPASSIAHLHLPRSTTGSSAYWICINLNIYPIFNVPVATVNCAVVMLVEGKYIFYSILFYSILFYSILFYSILFYSILYT